MNNQGWGLRVMLAFVALLCIALFISIILIQKNFSFLFKEDPFKELKPNNINENVTVKKTYPGLEREMVVGAKKYIKKVYNNNADEADFLKIKVSSMQKEKVLGKLNDINDSSVECSGYVACNQDDKGDLEYKAYLKCGKEYTTKGYIARYDDIIEK
ncbi:MAG: hypothetical protein PHD10_01120 [Bacilli bacterium]|nr:hypothetical protein [Bacilli bacterium]MDD4607722.1 hypothetical protein [Bacilli bacterium]